MVLVLLLLTEGCWEWRLVRVVVEGAVFAFSLPKRLRRYWKTMLMSSSRSQYSRSCFRRVDSGGASGVAPVAFRIVAGSGDRRGFRGWSCSSSIPQSAAWSDVAVSCSVGKKCGEWVEDMALLPS